MHKYGIIHRDLKPDNIMLIVDESGNILNAVVSDFGLAKIKGINDIFKNSKIGTIGYEPPEIIGGYINWCEKTDVWNLGIILHQLISCLMPFDGENKHEIRHKTILNDVKYTSKYFDNISNSCKDLILKCMEKNPQKRYSTYNILDHPWIRKHAYHVIKQYMNNFNNKDDLD